MASAATAAAAAVLALVLVAAVGGGAATALAASAPAAMASTPSTSGHPQLRAVPRTDSRVVRLAESGFTPGSPKPGGGDFTGDYFELTTCALESAPWSPFRFYFNLSNINIAEDHSGPKDVVLNYDTPQGGHYEYYANPCADVRTTTVAGYNGTCNAHGETAVCYCTTDFGKCESIADRRTEAWLINNEEEAIQNFTAGACDTDGKNWTTYIFYECDASSQGFARGTVEELHADTYGLCPSEHSTDYCTRCLRWGSNYACSLYVSPLLTNVQDPGNINTNLVAATNGASVNSKNAQIVVQKMDQYFRPYDSAGGASFYIQIPPGAQEFLYYESEYIDDGVEIVYLNARTTVPNPPSQGESLGQWTVDVMMTPTLPGPPGAEPGDSPDVLLYTITVDVNQYGSPGGPNGPGPNPGGMGGGWVFLICVAILLGLGGAFVLYRRRQPADGYRFAKM